MKILKYTASPTGKSTIGEIMRERRECRGCSIIGQIWNAMEAPRSSRSWLPPRMGEKFDDLVDEQVCVNERRVQYHVHYNSLIILFS